MKYLVTQSEMKQYDKNTIERLNYPSILLMERAALVTVEALRAEKGNAPYRVLVVAGCGNNGGDGFAAGRLLMLQGCRVDFVLLGDQSKCSAETAMQLDILKGYGYKPYDRITGSEYDIVIDAIFGIGLSRDIEGIYKEAVLKINEMDSCVCSIDIPSGIHAGSGRILGCAVRADLTVSYGFCKLGEILYPGAGYCGKIVCGQMGIDDNSFFGRQPHWYTYDSLEDIRLPYRRPDGNKGTFGKALVIAGSDSMCGAAVMAGKSVFKMGAGMVRIVTSKKNRDVILKAMPEAMLTLYDADAADYNGSDIDLCSESGLCSKNGICNESGICRESDFEEEFKESLAWADCILIGPGISKGRCASWLLDKCLNESSLPMVIDADGLNMLAEMQDISRKTFADRKVILTPHLGEFARLYGCSVKEAADNITTYPQELADRLNCVIVCKDARTIVAYPQAESGFINTSGNSGMATAGSGDVLAGIITGLLVQGMDAVQAAVAGVHLHGAAGDMAADKCGTLSMMATDIIEGVQELLKKLLS